jgi:hypothetical protein
MARPKVLHDGFLIPNANDVTNPRMAEPDRVDFNTLAHPLWGVVEGCGVTVAGTTASTPGGTLLVNGALTTLAPGSVGVGVGGSQDRFDLIVSDAGGILTVIVGTPSVDPVFPDPPLNTTVLAAVFAPTGSQSLADNVIDKRKFINKALLTKIAPGADLVRNLNGNGNHYLLGGDGKTTWEGDTWMWRSGEAELSIHRHLKLEGTLTAGGNGVFGGDVIATGNVYGANLHWDTATPVAPIEPASIWQNKSNGRIYVWRNGQWEELATLKSANPTGTIITSVEVPSVMMPLGWIPIDGRTVYETDVPALFGLTAFVNGLPSGSISGDAPNRQMRLPNGQGLALVTDWARAPGVKVSPNAGNLITLKVANMPRHGHNPRTSPAGAANPRVTINRAGNHAHNVYGGAHIHPVNDPGHQHNGMDYFGIGAPIIAVAWGARNKLDALFNDRNHTYSVEMMEWTKPANSNISIGSGGSEHWHIVDPNGEHDHTATVDAIPDHQHAVVEDQVGGDQPINITPEYMAVYSYIRS